MRQDWRIVADYPTFAYFYGEWGTRTDDMYFVGEEGLFHWNGATLAPVPGVPSFVGFSMWGSGPSDIWALGEGGAGYHFDGTTWTAKPAPGQVLSMWGSASNDVYAVGIAGQYHFDGTSWSVLSTTGMNTVHGSSATNVWVGGDGGVLRHYDGMTWATVDPGVTSSIRAIYAFSPTHVLIGTNNGISRMVGTTWTFEASAFVSAFAATSPSNVWAGTGIGEILHYDGVGWSTRTQPDQLDTAALFLVDGSLFEIGAENAVFRYDGLTVTATPSGTTARLNNVWGNAFSAFAVGDSGTILRWNGQAWSAMVSNTTIPLLAVWGTGPNNVYAAGSTATTGSGVLLHYDGNATNTWQAVAGRTDKYTEIWGSGTDDIYVACMRNSPLTTPCNSLHWNGSTWSVLQPNGFDFSTVWGRSATDVYIGLATPYALGTQSPFQHWNGTTWTTLAWPEEGVLDGGPNSVVSLGHQAPSQTEALMRRESDTVRTDISPNWSSGGGGTTAQRLMADVLVDGPGDMTAVGVEGIALHFDGTTWWRLATGVSEDLHAIGGTGRTAFAVGDAGRIVMIARDDGGAACPSAGAEQDCSDGIDNDCDFLIDARDPDCRGSGVCWAPTTMTCGSTVNATFGSGADTIRTYSCTTRQKIGHEDIYRVVPAANGTVAATLTNLGGNFDLMAVGSGPSGACDPAGNCLAVSENASTTDESVSVAVTASQPLFLIVDDEGGYASAQTYTLTVTCQ